MGSTKYQNAQPTHNQRYLEHIFHRFLAQQRADGFVAVKPIRALRLSSAEISADKGRAACNITFLETMVMSLAALRKSFRFFRINNSLIFATLSRNSFTTSGSAG